VSAESEAHNPAPQFEQLQGCGGNVDCTEATLRMAINELGPSFIYTLHVNIKNFLYFCNEVRRLTDAPFAMQINVRGNADLGHYAWYVTANGRSVGSVGA